MNNLNFAVCRAATL